MSNIGPIELETKRRYLVEFDPKRIPHLFTDVLIIGAGIAGMRAALAIDPSLQVVVATKDQVYNSNSAWAQGGIAGVFDPYDDIANHAADTMTAGKGLCDSVVVDTVVQEASERILELVGMGARFDEVAGGGIALTQEGGHSHRRVVHALGDATGKEVMRALIDRVRALPNVDIWEKTFTIDLLTRDRECRGALVWNPNHGKTFVWAKQTILATGGAGRLFRETTNPDIATADGQAMAFRAGAVLRDMEFMQFHPTVLYIAGGSRHLVSEAVRGEGAYLRDCHGYRFMADYNPLLELAPRDDVSRAITRQMEKTRHHCVYLDLSHLPVQLVRERFPHISQVCSDFGLDLAKDQIPVRPGAHYMIGGLKTDLEARTSLPRLFAAGEVSSTGLHGANRLASNSLLEGLVFGLRAGRNASNAALSESDVFTAHTIDSSPRSPAENIEEPLRVDDLLNSLTSEMWRNVGIERNAADLLAALHQVDFWDRYVGRREFSTVAGWELQNMLLVARTVIHAAMKREETRGTHSRSDFPLTDPEQADHIEVVRAS
ncbi:L-aspartate oxidase [Planctopirus limnophila DSM 3776]|uniref:L-aspartate oxidase n=1 Tax=Planctopirus limnophila (strain ATCC 43296 / DSM 3776 / IFAM 1008 / Mu 290) TaxID=521674 RepID=D5SUQ2_PLAL2|nr:L-aspartate oxidase [Planctopirus limnophila]ADG67104.1 L-aspartate oxidase [Planctopirus limnophila DSM 3776]